VKKFEHNLLLSGLKCKSRPIIQYSCFLDLYYLSQYSYHRRNVIYNNNSHNDWHEVLISCCSIIDDLTLRIHNVIIKKAQCTFFLSQRESVYCISIIISKSGNLHFNLNPTIAKVESSFTLSQQLFYNSQLTIWAIEGNKKFLPKKTDSFLFLLTNDMIITLNHLTKISTFTFN
jgi:hypothetical protein